MNKFDGYVIMSDLELLQEDTSKNWNDMAKLKAIK